MNALIFKPDEKVDYGPTVLDGFVRRTSVSALTSFDPESYAGCPRRYWFKYVDGKKEPETVAQGAGKTAHKELDTYLTTGSDVLSPVTRAGKHLLPAPGKDLIVEAQFGDLGKAIEYREAFHRGGRTEAGLLTKMERVAGLIAGMLPLDGYIDLRHERGEWVNNDGVLLKEESKLGIVREVCDHKTTSSIDSFAKSPGELAETVQMVGYANYVLNVAPDTDHVRVSHIYYQTRGPKAGKKVTAILSARAARDKWKRIDQLAVYIEEVAKAKRAEDVESQPKSCDAYRGCPHQAHCPQKRTFGSRTIANGGERMSLFGNVNKQTQTNGTSTTKPAGALFGAAKAPATDAVNRDEVEAAKRKLAAEDAPAVSLGFCSECGTKLTSQNASKLPNGSVKHIGCGAGQTVAPHQVTPPDAAKPTLVQTANPLPAKAMQEVTDPEIKARAEKLANAHAEEATKKAGTAAAPKSGRCPSGGQRLELLPKEIISRKTKCPGCAKEFKVKDDDFNEDCKSITVPGHNLPKVEAPPVVVKQAEPASAGQQAEVPVAQTPAPAVQQPQTQPATGIVILVDALKERGQRPLPLEDYWRPMMHELEKQAGGLDVRCASKDSPMAYGAWKGFLTAWVRENPPAPGLYFARGTSDFDTVVVDALASIADITRGVR